MLRPGSPALPALSEACCEGGFTLKRPQLANDRKVLIASSIRYDETGQFLHTRCFTVGVSQRVPGFLVGSAAPIFRCGR
jgi:hypothetical protein